jgi:hypothetical protein
MMNTINVVIPVSRRLGQVTFCISARTSCRNLNGLTRAIVVYPRRMNSAETPVSAVRDHAEIGIRCPTLKDEAAKRTLFGDTFAAEVRHRAASDACFLLPARREVKLAEYLGFFPTA